MQKLSDRRVIITSEKLYTLSNLSKRDLPNKKGSNPPG
jgi:hypothetical protein